VPALISFDVKENVSLALGDSSGFGRGNRRIIEVKPLTLVNGVGGVVTATDAGSMMYNDSG